MVRVYAKNFWGFGPASPANTDGARIRVTPSAVAKPVEDPATTDAKIVVTWTAISGTTAGNSPVLSYSLEWDEGNSLASSFTVLIDSLVTSHTVNGVTGGQTYRFKVRARNIYGYGDPSEVLSVIPDDKPGKVDIPTVILSPLDATDVQITWLEPNAHSAAI